MPPIAGPREPLHRLERLPAVCRQFLILLVCLTAACYLTEIFCGWALHLGIPYSWPLISHDFLMDFTRYIDQFKLVHTVAFFKGVNAPMYPMPMMMCYWALYSLHIGGVGFAVIITVLTLVAAIWTTRALVDSGLAVSRAVPLVFVTYVLSYPLFFEYQSGNVEIIVWATLCLGVWAWMRGRNWTAAALFGLAASFKLFPFVYLGLLLSKKRYKECVFGCGVAVLATLISLWAIGPTIPIAYHGTQTNIALYRDTYMLYIIKLFAGFDHSLFMDVKVALTAINHLRGQHPSFHERSLALSAYMAIIGLLGVLAYFLRIRHLPAVNQVICLTLAATLLPPMSFDYTLMHLYVPWALMCFVAVRAAQLGIEIKGLKAAFICLAIALAPMTEFILRDRTVASWIRALAMLALFLVALRYPFPLTPDESLIPALKPALS